MSKALQLVATDPQEFKIEVIAKNGGHYAVVYRNGVQWYQTALFIDRRHGDHTQESKQTVIGFAKTWIRNNHPDASVSPVDTA